MVSDRNDNKMSNNYKTEPKSQRIKRTDATKSAHAAARSSEMHSLEKLGKRKELCNKSHQNTSNGNHICTVFLCWLSQVYLSCFRVRDRVHPVQFASLSQG